MTRAALVCLLVLVGARAEAQDLALNDGPTDVTSTFLVSGSAIGADAVHVWAIPIDGGDPIFVGASYPQVTPDPVRQLQFGGFSVLAKDLPAGRYTVVVYAHDPVSGQFTTQAGRVYTVRSCVRRWECYPFLGPNGIPIFYIIEACR